MSLSLLAPASFCLFAQTLWSHPALGHSLRGTPSMPSKAFFLLTLISDSPWGSLASSLSLILGPQYPKQVATPGHLLVPKESTSRISLLCFKFFAPHSLCCGCCSQVWSDTLGWVLSQFWSQCLLVGHTPDGRTYTYCSCTDTCWRSHVFGSDWH